MKKESKIKKVIQIVMMSIALVTGLIFNTSCQQSDTEESEKSHTSNDSPGVLSSDIIDDESRFSVLKASAGVEPTASFRDERYNYYVFYLGRMSNVPLQKVQSFKYTKGIDYSKSFTTKISTTNEIAERINETTTLMKQWQKTLKEEFSNKLSTSLLSEEGVKAGVENSSTVTQGFQNTWGESKSESISYQIEKAEKFCKEHSDTTSFSFNKDYPTGFYRYVMMSDVEYYGIVIYDTRYKKYSITTKPVLVDEPYFTLDYSESGLFTKVNPDEFSLPFQDFDFFTLTPENEYIPENTAIIKSLDDLRRIKNLDDSNVIFKLANDIDGQGQVWEPVSDFKGTLIGNGYSIRNLKINSSKVENENSYCGFFFKNEGTIENIVFENITVTVSHEEQTDDWRYMYAGVVAGINYGTIKDVHLKNITLTSSLSHKNDRDGTPLQKNFTGGIAGANEGILSYCSIRNSSVTASTDAKENYCGSYAYAGGISGEIRENGKASDILSIETEVKATSRGGKWGGWSAPFQSKGDGTIGSYAGGIFGIVYGNVEKLVSFNNKQPSTENSVTADNPSKIETAGNIIAVLESNASVKQAYANTDNTLIGESKGNMEKCSQENNLNVSSCFIYDKKLGWQYWSVLSDKPENYLDI